MENLYKQKIKKNKEMSEPNSTKTMIDKFSKNNEAKGLIALTGGVAIAAFTIGGIAILKGALIAVGSIYLITKGVTFLVKSGRDDVNE